MYLRRMPSIGSTHCADLSCAQLGISTSVTGDKDGQDACITSTPVVCNRRTRRETMPVRLMSLGYEAYTAAGARKLASAGRSRRTAEGIWQEQLACLGVSAGAALLDVSSRSRKPLPDRGIATPRRVVQTAAPAW